MDHKEQQFTFYQMEALNALANGATEELLRDIFGGATGSHLWNKFVSFDYNLMRLYGTLDTGNRKVFASWLKTFYQLGGTL